MGEVIELGAHIEGHGWCMNCKHEWEAVAPVGTTRLECPSCGTHNGVWRGSCSPPEGQSLWVCSVCGNDVFTVQPHRAFCTRCGTTSYPWHGKIEEYAPADLIDFRRPE